MEVYIDINELRIVMYIDTKEVHIVMYIDTKEVHFVMYVFSCADKIAGSDYSLRHFSLCVRPSFRVEKLAPPPHPTERIFIKSGVRLFFLKIY